MSEIELMDLVDFLYCHDAIVLEYDKAMEIAQHILKHFNLEEKDGFEENE